MALMGAVTGQVIKVEDFSSNLVPCQNGPSAAPARKRGAAVGQVQPYEQRGGIRVFLVKEENPLVLDEPQEFPGCGRAELPDEEMRVEGNICADSEAMLLDDREGGGDGEREGAVSASPLALDIGVPGGEQCIVFRVKEEEREVALDPPQREHGLSVLLVSRSAALDQQVDQGHTSADGPLVSDLHPGSFTDSDGIWVSVPPGCGAEEGAAENEECEQSRERLIQTGSQPDVFVCTGEGELNTEQQNTEELLEFLVQTSDVEYSDSSDSEPEEEAFAMACYHEGSSSGTGKLTSKNLERSRFSPAVLQARQCGAGFRNRRARQCHTRLSHPEEYQDQVLARSRLRCHLCGLPCSLSRQLIEHQHSQHPLPSPPCSVRGVSSPSGTCRPACSTCACSTPLSTSAGCGPAPSSPAAAANAPSPPPASSPPTSEPTARARKQAGRRGRGERKNAKMPSSHRPPCFPFLTGTSAHTATSSSEMLRPKCAT
ncbi:uncharacterized protein LOC118229632 isoform X1 [Anguilla anguilla]|uniref:uncharacterized protein LOC118229632 isoform X1 n=1 Tax=Anguilla anguilla TaxID=7936 RepID=UPI0015AE3CFC|nr:uncharacterized protein LOC118229632 isoform X1 [Anguilla anguilla]